MATVKCPVCGYQKAVNLPDGGVWCDACYETYIIPDHTVRVWVAVDKDGAIYGHFAPPERVMEHEAWFNMIGNFFWNDAFGDPPTIDGRPMQWSDEPVLIEVSWRSVEE